MEHIPLNGLAIVGLTYPSTDKIWLWEYGSQQEIRFANHREMLLFQGLRDSQ